ncbi:MAG: nuclear transport factor 2 family protein [Fimbriimonas ginsengisoli]|uniref:Nuclear transport factor 2 family protein n=1 Tax=Fimbriimonas ginsengisoli TaxID=1005039 RepID=A0A931PX56_FIMGI|nr:nuclear transport factor 2 family protein [Fimbriimonas ginsengisoli]
MKRFVVLVLLAASLVAFASAPDRKAWLKTYAGIERVFNQRNMDAFEKMLDKDFTIQGQDGKTLNRVDFIKSELDPIRAAERFRCRVRVTSVKSVGADVAVGYDWAYRMWGKDEKGKFVMKGHEVGVDTWRKVEGRWLTVHTKVKSATQKREKAK